MEGLGAMGVVGFIFGLLAYTKAQRLERILRENGIGPTAAKSLGRRLSELVGETVTLTMYADDGDIYGQPCRVLDADETWALIRVDEGKKREKDKLIRLDDVKQVTVK